MCPSSPGKFYSMIDSLFEDMLLNVITNAIKYDEHEEMVEVEVMLESGVISGRPQNLIKVYDRGPGIQGQKKKSIFSRFERGGRGSVRCLTSCPASVASA